MHEGRRVFQRLHEVGQQRILEQHGHGAIRLQVARQHRAAVGPVGHDHRPQPRLQILQRFRKAEAGHDFRGHGDVEPALPGKAVLRPAKPGDHIAQRAVVHVQHPAPDHPAQVDVQRVAPVDVVVDHRRQQVMRGGDGVEIPGEMQVHRFHGHDLRKAAACRPALHAEIRTKRGFADADRRLLADGLQPVAQPDGGGGLALPRRGGVDRGDKDQPPGRAALQPGQGFGGKLGLVMAIGDQILRLQPQPRADLLNGPLFRGTGNVEVAGHGLGSGCGLSGPVHSRSDGAKSRGLGAISRAAPRPDRPRPADAGYAGAARPPAPADRAVPPRP